MIYRRQQKQNPIGDAILAGTQGFVQGQQIRQNREDRSIANQYRQAQIAELERKTAALDTPIEDPNYFRDPVTGKLNKRTVRVGVGGVSGAGNPNLTPTKFDAYGNPKEFQDFTTKPLSGDAASKYQAGMQGTENAQDLINTFGFERTPEGKVSAPGFLGKKIKLAAANFDLAGGIGVPGLSKVIEGGAQLVAGDEGKKLDLAMTTLAKNVYRSETGAAGNASEIENVKRRLMTRMTDSEQIALDRILSSEGFTRGVAESIKPGTTQAPTLPTRKAGGQIMVDAAGNRAMVFPDGTFEEIR